MVIYFNSYTEKYSWLSNFSPHPINNLCESEIPVFQTAEHLYQSYKTTDKDLIRWICSSKTPQEAKRRGSVVTLRPNWEEKKDDYMYVVLSLKFSDHPDLYQKLLDTHPHELVHSANWDEYWGDGREGKGQNKLGKLLMHIRQLP